MLRLIVDFGLCVLLWAVQLIIYPSFQYYQKEDLKRWHHIYTTRISYLVIPLMLSQVGLYAFLLSQSVCFPLPFNAGMIGVCWVITFAKAVPIHNQIASGVFSPIEIASLIRFNWVRTVLWTLVFVLDVVAIYWI